MNPLVLVWVAIPVTAVVAWVARSGGSMVSPVPADVDKLLSSASFARLRASWPAGNISIDGPGRLSNARIIVREFLAAGFDWKVSLAAVVNANAESSLDNKAIGDGGASVGLFQLHERGGGRGMSVADRQDPVLNARRMVQETKAAWNATYGNYRSLSSAVAAGAAVPELAGLFAVHVERPADKDGAYFARSASAKTLFPGV